MTTKHRVETPLAPPPRPQFSQGVRKGPVLQTAGQVGVDPATGAFADDLQGQTLLALQNVNAVLEAGGATFDDVVMVRVYLRAGGDFDVMNDVYDQFVPPRCHSGILPARTTVATEFASTEILVEIDALAVLGE
ncbi:MAG: RidA family protein [Pseudolysinimonas sp.]